MRASPQRAKLLVCLSLLSWQAVVSGGRAQTQTVPGAPAPIKITVAAADSYAGESIVIERTESLFAMNADGTGYRERTVVVKVQSEAALRQLGVLSVPFASASEHVEFKYARVRKPDGTVVETNPGDALEQPDPVTREAPFYSDLKEKQLPVKSLRVGDTLEWQARITRTKAEAQGQFWGQESLVEDTVVRSQVVELRVPASTTVTVWTNPKLALKPSETVVGEQRIYRWEHSHLKPTVGKEAEDEKAAKKKRLLTADEEIDVREGALPSLAWTTFKSWQQVGEWFHGLEADRTVPDDAIKAKVAEVTAGKTTEEAKVKAVYGYVAGQIRYIGVAFGVGRYQPHRASDVLENQYGDCKDKHTLLAAMLHVLGENADAVLIGAGIRFNEAVPSPAAFNHLITHLHLNGQEVWLDATAEVAPYRMLVAVTRDKPALVVPDAGPAVVERTPATPPFESTQNWTAVGTLDQNGVSDSHITWSVRGDSEIILRTVVRQVAPGQYDELMQRMSASIGYSGTTSHVVFSRVDDTEEPFTLSYDYHREKAGDWDHYKTVAQLPPAGLPMVDEKEPPVQSIELGPPYTETSHAEMKLPQGWGVELPEAIHERTDFATFDTSYKFDKGVLYSDRKVVILKERVPAKDWKIYKKWQDAISLGQEPFIQLTHVTVRAALDAALPNLAPKLVGGSGKVAVSNEEAPAVAGPSNAEAQKLVQEAFSALDQHDLGRAAQAIDKAYDLNPTQNGLWGAKGYQALLRGETTESLRDYQKELALHPDSYWAYQSIVQTQLSTDKRDDALATLRAWANADASDATPTIRLVNLLLEDGNAAAALEAATAGVARLPEDRRKDEAIQLALGHAQLKAGELTEGEQTMTALLKSSDNPNTLNSAAYELADANRALPLAETSVRAALDKLAAESTTWTLDESPQTLKQKTALIVASWDTLGWILFREGKVDQAAEYIEAAWLNGNDIVVGEHLGDVDAALHKYTEAMTAYDLAAATVSPYNMLGVRRPETPAQKALHAKAEKMKKLGGKAVVKNAVNGLTDIRKLQLGPANGHKGYAEYKLLIAHDHVLLAEPVEAKSLEDGVEIVRKAKLPHLIPQGSEVRLVRDAFLNCHSDVCELLFQP